MTLNLPGACLRGTSRRTPYRAPPRKRPREAPLANETNRNIIYVGRGVNPVVRIWRTLAIEENDTGELHDRHVHRLLAKPRSRSEADTSSEARLSGPESVLKSMSGNDPKRTFGTPKLTMKMV